MATAQPGTHPVDTQERDIKSAIDFNASESAGLDGALKRLGQTGWGDFLIVFVGIGLFAYGVYSFVEARYRRVLDG